MHQSPWSFGFDSPNERKQAHPVFSVKVPPGAFSSMQRDEMQRAGQHSPPGGWPSGIYLSIIPAWTRDTLTETRTHGFGLVAICGIQRYFGGRGRRPQGHPPRHRRQLPRARTYRTWLQCIDPQTAGKPACTSYIGAKVAQHFETGWGCRCRVLHRSRPAPKVGDQNARARRPSPHQKSAFLHHLGRQH